MKELDKELEEIYMQRDSAECTAGQSKSSKNIEVQRKEQMKVLFDNSDSKSDL